MKKRDSLDIVKDILIVTAQAEEVEEDVQNGSNQPI